MKANKHESWGDWQQISVDVDLSLCLLCCVAQWMPSYWWTCPRLSNQCLMQMSLMFRIARPGNGTQIQPVANRSGSERKSKGDAKKNKSVVVLNVMQNTLLSELGDPFMFYRQSQVRHCPRFYQELVSVSSAIPFSWLEEHSNSLAHPQWNCRLS